MTSADYLSGTTTVLWAGRALSSALESDDDVEIQEAVAELLRVARARETGGDAVRGFAPAPGGPAAETSASEELTKVLTELDLGQTLLVAAGSVGEPGAPPAEVPLGHALDQLDADVQLMHKAGEPSVLGFAAGTDPRLPAADVLRTSFEAAVASVVGHTAGIGAEVLKGLTAVPLAAVQPVAAGAVQVVGAIPQVGPLVAGALRAVGRAVRALERLLPESIRPRLRELAAQWWSEDGGSIVTVTVRRFLGAAEVERAAEQLWGLTFDDSRARRAATELDALGARHEQMTTVVTRIVRALSALLGPVTAMLAAAAAWLYATASLAFLSAFAAGLWLGRDCLDTGMPLERVPGVRSILATVTP